MIAVDVIVIGGAAVGALAVVGGLVWGIVRHRRHGHPAREERG